MRQIRKEPGFDVLADGNIIARYGVQSNCAGIVQIQFRIDPIETSGIKFAWEDNESEFGDLGNWEFVTGTDMPECFRKSVLTGAAECYLESSYSDGIKYTLISAFVHAIDASELMFLYLGRISFFAWYHSSLDSNKTAWTMRELAETYPNLYRSSD